MNHPIFIDTGAFYARYVTRDSYHSSALELWKKIRQAHLACMTTNFVIAELINLFAYRVGTQQALQATREIYSSEVIQIVSITSEIELRALDWMERFADQDFSMTDAVSFAIMEEKKLSTAFTFDHHFEIAGFAKLTIAE